MNISAKTIGHIGSFLTFEEKLYFQDAVPQVKQEKAIQALFRGCENLLANFDARNTLATCQGNDFNVRGPTLYIADLVTELNLSSLTVTAVAIKKIISYFPQVKRLIFDSTHIARETLLAISAWNRLSTLSLSWSYFSEVDLTDFYRECRAKQLPLQKLILDGTPVTGSSFQELPDSAKLLSICHCLALEDEQLLDLKQKKRLSHLRLQLAQIKGHFLAEALPENMRQLDVDQSTISLAYLQELESMRPGKITVSGKDNLRNPAPQKTVIEKPPSPKSSCEEFCLTQLVEAR